MENFLDNLKCLNDVLRMWEYRGLSLEGKILIFKSLAISKLIYVCMMKSPSKKIIDQLNTIQKEFIWNNKKPKIKHSTLIANYSEGGLKDIDIKSKITSLKVKWITRLLDNNFHPWKIVPKYYFSNVGGIIIIFHSNLQLSKQCSIRIKQIPAFYQELVQIWGTVSKKEPEEILEICSEVIWNNKLILDNEESLFNEYFINKGIITIQDIINEQGDVLQWIEARQKYLLSSAYILNWLGIIKCLPKRWKDKLKTKYNNLLNGNTDNINLLNKNARIITTQSAYIKLVEPLINTPTSQNSLTKLLDLENVDWKKVYMLPRRVTIESSLRSFQYKILNNILYLNDRLYKFNIVDSPLCSLCKLEKESVIHLFCTCTVSKKLWKQLQSWLPGLPDLYPEMIILGQWNEDSSQNIINNHIILIFKRYIYNKKQAYTNSLNIIGLKAYIKSIEKTEKQIAEQKDKLKLHYEKWDVLLPIM